MGESKIISNCSVEKEGDEGSEQRVYYVFGRNSNVDPAGSAKGSDTRYLRSSTSTMAASLAQRRLTLKCKLADEKQTKKNGKADSSKVTSTEKRDKSRKKEEEEKAQSLIRTEETGCCDSKKLTLKCKLADEKQTKKNGKADSSKVTSTGKRGKSRKKKEEKKTTKSLIGTEETGCSDSKKNGHMLTHRNKKLFECDAEGCGKSYCVAQSLRRHKKNHHSSQSTLATPLAVTSLGKSVAVIPGLAHLANFNSLQSSFPASVITSSANTSTTDTSVGNRIQYAPVTSISAQSSTVSNEMVTKAAPNSIVGFIIPTVTSHLQFHTFHQQPTTKSSVQTTTTSTVASAASKVDRIVLATWPSQTINTGALLLTQNLDRPQQATKSAQFLAEAFNLSSSTADHGKALPTSLSDSSLLSDVNKSLNFLSEKDSNKRPTSKEYLSKCKDITSFSSSPEKLNNHRLNLTVVSCTDTAINSPFSSDTKLNVVQNHENKKRKNSTSSAPTTPINKEPSVNFQMESPLLQQLLNQQQNIEVNRIPQNYSDLSFLSTLREQPNSQQSSMSQPSRIQVPQWSQAKATVTNSSVTTTTTANRQSKDKSRKKEEEEKTPSLIGTEETGCCDSKNNVSLNAIKHVTFAEEIDVRYCTSSESNFSLNDLHCDEDPKSPPEQPLAIDEELDKSDDQTLTDYADEKNCNCIYTPSSNDEDELITSEEIMVNEIDSVADNEREKAGTPGNQSESQKNTFVKMHSLESKYFRCRREENNIVIVNNNESPISTESSDNEESVLLFRTSTYANPRDYYSKPSDDDYELPSSFLQSGFGTPDMFYFQEKHKGLKVPNTKETMGMPAIEKEMDNESSKKATGLGKSASVMKNKAKDVFNNEQGEFFSKSRKDIMENSHFDTEDMSNAKPLNEHSVFLANLEKETNSKKLDNSKLKYNASEELFELEKLMKSVTEVMEYEENKNISEECKKEQQSPMEEENSNNITIVCDKKLKTKNGLSNSTCGLLSAAKSPNNLRMNCAEVKPTEYLVDVRDWSKEILQCKVASTTSQQKVKNNISSLHYEEDGIVQVPSENDSADDFREIAVFPRANRKNEATKKSKKPVKKNGNHGKANAQSKETEFIPPYDFWKGLEDLDNDIQNSSTELKTEQDQNSSSHSLDSGDLFSDLQLSEENKVDYKTAKPWSQKNIFQSHDTVTSSQYNHGSSAVKSHDIESMPEFISETPFSDIKHLNPLDSFESFSSKHQIPQYESKISPEDIPQKHAILEINDGKKSNPPMETNAPRKILNKKKLDDNASASFVTMNHKPEAVECTAFDEKSQFQEKAKPLSLSNLSTSIYKPSHLSEKREKRLSTPSIPTFASKHQQSFQQSPGSACKSKIPVLKSGFKRQANSSRKFLNSYEEFNDDNLETLNSSKSNTEAFMDIHINSPVKTEKSNAQETLSMSNKCSSAKRGIAASKHDRKASSSKDKTGENDAKPLKSRNKINVNESEENEDDLQLENNNTHANTSNYSYANFKNFIITRIFKPNNQVGDTTKQFAKKSTSANSNESAYHESKANASGTSSSSSVSCFDMETVTNSSDPSSSESDSGSFSMLANLRKKQKFERKSTHKPGSHKNPVLIKMSSKKRKRSNNDFTPRMRALSSPPRKLLRYETSAVLETPEADDKLKVHSDSTNKQVITPALKSKSVASVSPVSRMELNTKKNSIPQNKKEKVIAYSKDALSENKTDEEPNTSGKQIYAPSSFIKSKGKSHSILRSSQKQGKDPNPKKNYPYFICNQEKGTYASKNLLTCNMRDKGDPKQVKSYPWKTPSTLLDREERMTGNKGKNISVVKTLFPEKKPDKDEGSKQAKNCSPEDPWERIMHINSPKNSSEEEEELMSFGMKPSFKKRQLKYSNFFTGKNVDKNITYDVTKERHSFPNVMRKTETNIETSGLSNGQHGMGLIPMRSKMTNPVNVSNKQQINLRKPILNSCFQGHIPATSPTLNHAIVQMRQTAGVRQPYKKILASSEIQQKQDLFHSEMVPMSQGADFVQMAKPSQSGLVKHTDIFAIKTTTIMGAADDKKAGSSTMNWKDANSWKYSETSKNQRLNESDGHQFMIEPVSNSKGLAVASPDTNYSRAIHAAYSLPAPTLPKTVHKNFKSKACWVKDYIPPKFKRGESQRFGISISDDEQPANDSTAEPNSSAETSSQDLQDEISMLLRNVNMEEGFEITF